MVIAPTNRAPAGPPPPPGLLTVRVSTGRRALAASAGTAWTPRVPWLSSRPAWPCPFRQRERCGQADSTAPAPYRLLPELRASKAPRDIISHVTRSPAEIPARTLEQSWKPILSGSERQRNPSQHPVYSFPVAAVTKFHECGHSFHLPKSLLGVDTHLPQPRPAPR